MSITMPILFEVLKIVFFVSSIIIALFTLRGYYYIPDATFSSLTNMLLPGYLLITGLMIGYLYILYIKTRDAEAMTNKQRVTGFLLGLTIGILLAIAYIFLHN